MKDWLIGFLLFTIFLQWLAVEGLQEKLKNLKDKTKEVESLLKNYNTAKSDLYEITKKYLGEDGWKKKK